MNPQKVNKVIAEWLGIKKQSDFMGREYWVRNNGLIMWTEPDFLHDRNQQKWIEDELIEKGYGILSQWFFLSEMWNIEIYSDLVNSYEITIDKSNKSKDQAFIDAVMELINQEEKK